MLPKDRSTSVKVKVRKTPKGIKKIYVKDKKTNKRSCPICKSKLFGIGNENENKTAKRVTRIFGGMICHKCVSEIIKEATRVREKIKNIDNVDISLRKYVEIVLKKV